MMWNNTTIELIYEEDIDQTSVIQSLFLSSKDLSNGERLDSHIDKFDNKYTISYSQNHYSDREEVIFLSKELAKAQPHCPFVLSSRSGNEGSGGNYTEIVFVAYKYGTFSSKYYSNSEMFISEHESEDPPIPRLIEANISQLFPKDDFVNETTDLIIQDQFVDISVIGENKFIIDNGKVTEYIGSGEGDLLIPDGITSLRDDIFNNGVFGKRAFSKAIIPDGVTYIGSFAFRECKNLTCVSIPDSVTGIGAGAFYECESLTSITMPEGITTIGGSTFRGTNIERLEIPKSVSFIGRGAFSICRELKEISIPYGVKSIEADTFIGCFNLSTVTIPETVTSIGDKAFYNCSGLTSISIPKSVTSIGDRAFYGCKNLRMMSLPEEIMSQLIRMKPEKYGKAVLEDGLWSILCPAQQKDLFLSKQGKAVTALYTKCLSDDQVAPLGQELLNMFNNPLSAKECNNIAVFVSLFYSKLSKDIIQSFYHQLNIQKNGKKAVDMIKNDDDIAQLLDVDLS